MSKPVKNLIRKFYEEQFGELDGAVLINICGIESNTNNELRTALAEKAIRVTIVKNTLAKAAFTGTQIEPIKDMFDGPTAMVYGGESVVDVARELVEQAKTINELEFKGAVMEGQIFGPTEIERLSKFPTKDEAQAQVIQVVLGPAGSLISTFTGAGSAICSILSAIEDKLENGETIEKVA